MPQYLLNLWIWLDQGLNVLLAGSPDETLSARAWRRRSVSQWYVWIDALFFWQQDHCQTAFNAEAQRKQLPKGYQ